MSIHGASSRRSEPNRGAIHAALPMQASRDNRDAGNSSDGGGCSAARSESVREPTLQRASNPPKRKRTVSTVGHLVSELIRNAETNSATDADVGGRSRQRRKRVRILRRKAGTGLYVPGKDVTDAIVELWLKQGATENELLEVVRAICHAKAALPLVVAGRRWPMPPEVPTTISIADLNAVGPALAVRMPPHCIGPLLRIAGTVRDALLNCLRCVPVETQHVLNVRRPDLYWFVATCNYRISNSGAGAHSSLRAAIYEPWQLHLGSQTLRDFTWAATAVEATFARPGGDIFVAGTPAAAVSLRDKTLLLYVLLWGKPAYASTNCPRCAPAQIRALVSVIRRVPSSHRQ